jgi:hypothetical protein
VEYLLCALAGIAAGCVQLYLLRKFIRAVLTGDFKKVLVLMPVKLLLYAAVLVPAFIIIPELLWFVGLALVAPIIVGGIIIFIKNSINSKKN